MFKDEGSPLTAWQSDLLQICINRGREIVFYSEPVVVENLLVFEPLVVYGLLHPKAIFSF